MNLHIINPKNIYKINNLELMVLKRWVDKEIILILMKKVIIENRTDSTQTPKN